MSYALQPQTPRGPQVEARRTKTLFVGNLSFSIQQADVYVFHLRVFLHAHIYCLTQYILTVRLSLKMLVKLLISVFPWMGMEILGVLGMLNLPHLRPLKRYALFYINNIFYLYAEFNISKAFESDIVACKMIIDIFLKSNSCKL